MSNILIPDCVYTNLVIDKNFKKLIFKQLSFSHLRLITIGTSYCLWILVKPILTRLNKHLSLQGFLRDFKDIVLTSYSKCWNVNADKTEFRSKDNIEISAVTLVFKTRRLIHRNPD